MTLTDIILMLLNDMHYGAALIDNLGAVTGLNACADRILSKYAERQGCISTNPESATKLLRRLFGKEFADPRRGIMIANGAKSRMRPLLACNVGLLRASSSDLPMIFLLIDLEEHPGARTAVLRQAFGLTEAEARLAARLARGDSVHDIASDHRVAIHTARGQLKSVLAKTHTHRQAELVALVNRLAPLISEVG